MTPTFREEWRTIDPSNPKTIARKYDNYDDAHADTERNSWRIVQHRLVSDWEDDQ